MFALDNAPADVCHSDVIATFGNTCYVWDLHSISERRVFHVPNLGYFASIACRDRTVICARPASDHFDVYIWEYASQVGKSIKLQHASDSPLLPKDPE